ncbi:MAG: dockerin type I repeat-containing protein [Ruminococcus sp.]|nr:dockerin type I repeat-containing protein [Ruminococcus sp.]
MFKSKIIRIISMVSAVACITTCVNLSSVTNISYADDYNSRVETMVLEEENNIKSYPVEIAGDFMTFIIEGTPGTNVNGCLVGYTYKGEEGEKIEWKGKIRDDGTLKVEIDTYNIYGYKGEFQIWESDDNSAELVNQQIWVTTTADMRSTTTTTTTTSGTTMTTTSGTTMPKTSGTTMTTTSGTKITTTSSTTITTTSGTTMTIKSYPVEIAGDFMTFIIEGTPGTNVNGCLVGYTYKGEEGEKIEWKGKIRDDGTLKVEIDTYNIYGYKGEFQIWESDDNSAELVNQQIWVTTTADMRSTTTTTTTTSGTTMTTTSGTTMPKTSGTTMTTTSGTKITTTSSTTITTTSGTTMTTTPTITTTSGTTMTTTNTMPAPVGYIAGDANCDNEVNIADATAIVQHLGNKDKYGLSEAGERNADVDGVEGVTGSDALVLQQVEANMISLADLPLKK